MRKLRLLLPIALATLLTVPFDALAGSPYDQDAPYRCRMVNLVIGRRVLANRGPIVSGFGSQCIKRRHGPWEIRHAVLNNHTPRIVDVVFRAEVRRGGRWVPESRSKKYATLRPFERMKFAHAGAQRPTGNRIRFKVIKARPR